MIQCEISICIEQVAALALLLAAIAIHLNHKQYMNLNTTSELNVPDTTRTRYEWTLTFTASRCRGSPIHGERLAWVTATAVSSALSTKVFAANYKKVNEFLHRQVGDS